MFEIALSSSGKVVIRARHQDEAFDVLLQFSRGQTRVESSRACVSCTGGMTHDEDRVRLSVGETGIARLVQVIYDPCNGVADVFCWPGELDVGYESVIGHDDDESFLGEIRPEIGVLKVGWGRQCAFATRESASVYEE